MFVNGACLHLRSSFSVDVRECVLMNGTAAECVPGLLYAERP